MKSFIVRVWTSDDPLDPGDDGLHGLVEQVGSGRSTAFGDVGELVAFLSQPAPPGPAAVVLPREPRTQGGPR